MKKSLPHYCVKVIRGIPLTRKFKPLTAEELRVKKTGQLATSLEGEIVFSLNAKDAEERMRTLAASRKRLSGYPVDRRIVKCHTPFLNLPVSL